MATDQALEFTLAKISFQKRSSLIIRQFFLSLMSVFCINIITIGNNILEE